MEEELEEEEEEEEDEEDNEYLDEETVEQFEDRVLNKRAAQVTPHPLVSSSFSTCLFTLLVPRNPVF